MDTRTHNISSAKHLFFILFLLFMVSCNGQVTEKSANSIKVVDNSSPTLALKPNTTFPQVHTNLNGMVREFVRVMYQDKKGNYWFGTNGDGVIRYDGHSLQKEKIRQKDRFVSIREIVEDDMGNIWFGTSSGLVRYDGEQYTSFSTESGLQDDDIWGLTLDKRGRLWIGTLEGISIFDGEGFVPFLIPDNRVEAPQPMLSHKLVKNFLEDKNGTMWLVTDGNGIFQYKDGTFIHLTTANGLVDNNVTEVYEDCRGDIWIGTYYGGVCKYDGSKYIHFTKEGTIEGIETFNFYEDSHGHIWFSAEGYGVYRYDGNQFTQYTREEGLAADVVLSMMEDDKGQLWFGTWQGISIYNGDQIVNANILEPWTQ